MSYTLVRNLVAVVLLAAAGLKAHQLATEPVSGVGLLDSRWFLIATVEFELFFGLWLFSNNLPRPTWAVALGCFALFGFVSLYKALSGSASCGCFGRVSVNPWYTATLDLAIVASLLRWRPKEAALASPIYFQELRRRAMAVLAIWFVIGAPTAFAMSAYSATTLSDAGAIIGDGRVVVLEPETWIGKRFPLLEYIDIGEQLSTGEWLVVLYHHDCPKCREVVAFYESASLMKAPVSARPRRVALVEVPPFGLRPCSGLSADRSCFHTRLTNDREWFVATPTTITIAEGVVVQLTNENH